MLESRTIIESIYRSSFTQVAIAWTKFTLTIAEKDFRNAKKRSRHSPSLSYSLNYIGNSVLDSLSSF